MRHTGMVVMALVLTVAGVGAWDAVEWLSLGADLNVAAGASTEDDVGVLAVGHHDPTREAGSVQGLELGVSLRAHEALHGFATYTLHYGEAEEWESEWEEAFLKLLGLPGGFELRGGRALARYGVQNATHLHGWDFVDMPLVSGLFLGDDGLLLDGGDLTWIRRDRELTLGAIGGYGGVKRHAHGHDDSHDDAVADGDDHGHALDAGGWDENVGYGRLFALYRRSDFHQWTLGASGAFGDDEANRLRSVWGVDLTYEWRADGMDEGGRALRWASELMAKIDDVPHGTPEEDSHADHHDEADHEAATSERASTLGFYTQAVYTWNERWDTGVRIGAIESEAYRESRFRASPALTWRPLGRPGVAMRLQYNYDVVGSTDAHTVWAQLGLSWGGDEVR